MTAAAPAPRRSTPLRPAHLLLVIVGGMLGTAARFGVSLAIPAADGLPWPTLLVNLVGAFLLGCLLTVLASSPRRTTGVRMLLGTGALGSFTTYSALAVETTTLLNGRVGLGVTYALVTLVVGAAATFLGMLTASALRPKAGTRA